MSILQSKLDDFINELVQSKVESILENYKRQLQLILKIYSRTRVSQLYKIKLFVSLKS